MFFSLLGLVTAQQWGFTSLENAKSDFQFPLGDPLKIKNIGMDVMDAYVHRHHKVDYYFFADPFNDPAQRTAEWPTSDITETHTTAASTFRAMRDWQ